MRYITGSENIWLHPTKSRVTDVTIHYCQCCMHVFMQVWNVKGKRTVDERHRCTCTLDLCRVCGNCTKHCACRHVLAIKGQ